MTPTQRAMWELSAPLWHGLARAGVFLTANGPQICELNCDTPSGFAEAIVLNELCRGSVEGTFDPNEAFAGRYLAMATTLGRMLGPNARGDTVGIVYPTEMPEDLSVIRLLRRWFEEAGHDVVLGSPFNLSRAEDGSVGLFGEPIALLLRHYKTDWWGEREPVWDDEPAFPDALPLLHELRILAEASVTGRTVVVNPFGSVVPQNKRAMAYLWEHRARFSPASRVAIEPVAEILRETLAHYLGADSDNQDNRITIIDRIVREQAFTVLNRLAALLMMEARGQLIESVRKGYQSRGYQLYSRIAGTVLGETGDAYQTYLYSLFDEFALELPALFSRFAANGLFFPRETALRALLVELTHFEVEPLWAEDETIGWIYQYFNSKEERKAMRDASQAPRNSREPA